MNNTLIISALGGAIIWNLITWWLGLPSSSSHALIGGLIGAGLMKGGFEVLVWKGILKTSSFIVVSPVDWPGPRSGFDDRRFESVPIQQYEQIQPHFQEIAVVLGSDLQHQPRHERCPKKPMGIIALVLFSSGYLGPTFHIPFGVVILCYTVIALGTMSGGWRIVKTMGTKITQTAADRRLLRGNGGGHIHYRRISCR